MSTDRYESLNQERKFVEEKKKVAVYCRVSTDKEDQTNSLESQERYFRQYIEKNPNWELYGVFADEGISGTNTKKRKEFIRMIACAKQGCFDLIITKEISRFARNTLDSIYYTRDLKKHGVGVIFMNDNINTLEGDAELRLAIMSSIAQEESRKTSERVKWGQKRQMEKGIVFGRNMLGYNVHNGKMYLDEEGAKTVRLIFHKFVREKKGTHVIARELGESGIMPMRGKEWQNTVILRILRNEKYCGDLIQKKTYTPDFLSHEKKYNHGQEEFIIIRNHHEPIISRALFDEANRILDERSLSQTKVPKYSNRYLFSGKIRCGCCGGSYVARCKKRKDGSEYKAWRCYKAMGPHTSSVKNPKCIGSSIRNEDLIYVMALVTRSLLFEEGILDHLISVIQSVLTENAVDSDILSVQQQIQTVENEKFHLIELYMNELITKQEFQTARNNCDEKMDALRLMSATEQNHRDRVQTQNDLQNITTAVKEIISGVEREDEFYRQLLEKIVLLDKDHVEVSLRYFPYKWSYAVKE